MPTSTQYFKSETLKFFTKYITSDDLILDVGCGTGTYSDLLRPMGYNNIHGVEVFPDYIANYSLKDKYDRLYHDNILELPSSILTIYDVVIMGDVWEHLSKPDADKLYKSFMRHQTVIIAVPFNAPQGEHFGNKYEIHLQPELTHDKMMEYYPDLIPLCLRYDYGVYIKTAKQLFEPLYVLHLGGEMLNRLLDEGKTLVKAKHEYKSASPTDW